MDPQGCRSPSDMLSVWLGTVSAILSYTVTSRYRKSVAPTMYCTVRLRRFASLYGKKSYSMPDDAPSARSVFEKLDVANDARLPHDHWPVRLLTTSPLMFELSVMLLTTWPSSNLNRFSL